MKTTFFANFVMMVMVVILTACSGMEDKWEDIQPQNVTNIVRGQFNQMIAEDAHLMLETDSANLGNYYVTDKGEFAQVGNVWVARVLGIDGQVSTITITAPVGFTVNAELKVNHTEAQLTTKGAWSVNKTFTATISYSGYDENGDAVRGTEVLETKIAHVQYDPAQNLKVVKEIQIVTKDSIRYLPGDTVYTPGPEVIRTDTVERLVKLAPRTYVRQSAKNEKDIIEMTNPGTFNVTNKGEFINGKLSWNGIDGQVSTAVLNADDDTEVSNIRSSVSFNVVKLHEQVYRVDQTLTTKAHIRCTTEHYERDLDTTLVSKISHYQVDPTVPTETVTEYVNVEVHDTLYVDVPGPEVIVEITKTEEKEVYIYVPGKELFVYIDGGVANVKLDDENVLEAALTLKERKVEIEKSNLGKVELSNASALGAKNRSFNFDDSQVGTVSFSANGCSVKSIEFDHFEAKELRKDSLSLIKLFFKVTFQYQDVKVEDNEVVTTVKERSFLLSKPYVQKAQEEIVPVVYEPTLDWNLSATATEVSLSCKVGVEASDGSFKKVYSWKAALAGLESYTNTLYLDGQTSEVTDGNYTGVLSNEAETKWSKDSVWTSVRKNLQTKDASKWMLDNGTLVGPNNNINYYHTTLICHLPNGEDIKWEVVPETVVDNHSFTSENVATHTLSDGRTATYWQTLHTGIHHYVTIKVTYQGETNVLEIPCLQEKSGGKYILCENTCDVNLFTTK